MCPTAKSNPASAPVRPIEAIRRALPSWPHQQEKEAYWYGLAKDFRFSHHATGDKKTRSESDSGSEDHKTEHFFCAPKPQLERLKSVLLKSRGGSILVTGYRGSGKSSLVNAALSDISNGSGRDHSNKVPKILRLNLSSPRNGIELAKMVLEALHEERKNFLLGSLEQLQRKLRAWLNLHVPDAALGLAIRVFSRLWSLVSSGLPASLTLTALILWWEILASKGFVPDVASMLASYIGPQSWFNQIAPAASRFAEWFVGLGILVLVCRSLRPSQHRGARLRSDIEQLWRDTTETRSRRRKGQVQTSGIGMSAAKLPVASLSVEDMRESPPLELHSLQRRLDAIIKKISGCGFQLIFVFDELDKLTPSPRDLDKATLELEHLKKIVSDLKFLLTEGSAHYIFIAGKDADDSWQEDQNKGEGILESVFVVNIYVPSLFKAELDPTLGPHEQWITKKWRSSITKKWGTSIPDEWRSNLLKGIIKEIGIDPESWAYNTALLVIPYLAESEILRLLRRVKLGRPESDQGCNGPYAWLYPILGPDPKPAKRKASARRCRRLRTLILRLLRRVKLGRPESDQGCDGPYAWLYLILGPDPKPAERIASARRCRRLRTLILYLTYKGRGIPRKILREFYGMIAPQDRIKSIPEMRHEKMDTYWAERAEALLDKRDRKGPSHVLFVRDAVQKKMTFFAEIVAVLESKQSVFRGLEDKAFVSMFHILDYILKHYEGGFDWSDLDHASFLTRRQDLFPGRTLVHRILEILEGVVIVRVNRRTHVYRLLPQIKADLDKLYLAFGPDQIELRFTQADHYDEIDKLEARIASFAEKHAEAAGIAEARIRLAKIYESMGDVFLARAYYTEALLVIEKDVQAVLRIKTEPASELLKTEPLRRMASVKIDILHRLGHLHEVSRNMRNAQETYIEALRCYEAMLPLIADCEGTPLFHEKVSGVLYPEQQNNWPTLFSNNWKILKSSRPWLFAPETEGLFGKRSAPTFYDGFDSAGRLGHTLRHLAYACEKLAQRRSAYHYLNLAYQAARFTGDRYAAIDNAIHIAQFLMRRRSLRGAWDWYAVALKHINEIAGDEGNSPTYDTRMRYQTSMAAIVWEGLGDIYHATHGCILLDSQPRDMAERRSEIGKSLVAFLRNFKVLKDITEAADIRKYELFYSQARILNSACGDEIGAANLYLKKMIVRSERFFELFQIGHEKSFGNKNEWDAHLEFAFCSFWRGAQRALQTILFEAPKISKIEPQEMGKVLQPRAVSALLSITGRFLLDFASVSRSGWKRVIWRRLYNALTGATEPKGCSTFLPTLHFHDKLKIRLEPLCEATVNGKALGESFNQLCKYAMDASFNFSPPETPLAPGWRSPLWNLQKEPDEKNGFCGFTDALSEVPVSDNQLQIWRLAECFLLNSFVQEKSHLANCETADTCHSLGELYLRYIWHLIDAGKPWTDKVFQLYFDLHLASKRFLAAGIAIYEKESGQGDTQRRILADIYADMSELLLIRGIIIERGEENVGCALKQKLAKTWTGAEAGWDFKRHPTEIGDHRIGEVSMECLSYARKTIQALLNEIESHNNEYPFPVEVYHRHGNVMDRDLQFDIASVVRRRFNPSPGNLSSTDNTAKIRCDLAIKLTQPTTAETWIADSIKLLTEANPYLKRSRSHLFEPVQGIHPKDGRYFAL